MEQLPQGVRAACAEHNLAGVVLPDDPCNRHRLTYRYGSFIRPKVIVIVHVNGTVLIGISEPTTVAVVCPVTLLPVVVTYAVILVHCPEDVVEYLAMS
jgi:hypothetical protein